MNEVIAEWYSVDLSVKITDAKRRRAEGGLLNGMLPFGYIKGADGIAERVDNESKLVLQAYEMYASGNYTCQQIASWLNTTGTYPRTHRKERKNRTSIWSKSSVEGMLSNPVYAGDVTYKGKRLPGKHQLIVDNELFETVQSVKRQHRRGPWTYTPKHRTYLLGGILFCARCGTKLWAQHLSGKDYYREEVSRRGLPCTGTKHTVRANILEAQVEQIILSLTLPESWRALVLDYLSSSEEREAAMREKRSLEEKRRRLYRAYADGMPEDDYRRELLATEATLRGLKDVQMEEVITLGDHVEGLIQAWHHATKEEKRQILVTMLDGVHVDFTSQQVVALSIKPAFKPLFKAWLDNDDGGGMSTRLTLGKIDVVHGDPDRSRDPTQYLSEGWYPVYAPQRLYVNGTANFKLPSDVWSELAERYKTSSLRGLAKEYGVSFETVRRRLMIASSIQQD